MIYDVFIDEALRFAMVTISIVYKYLGLNVTDA